MSGLDIPSQSIWLPGVGAISLDVRAVARAIEEYDDRFTLGRDQLSGDFIVVMKRGPNNGEPFPVLALGRELPGVDAVKKKLYESDTARHGGKIAQQILRRNDARQAAARKEASDKTEVAAEAIEWGLRKQGKHPHPRVFIPGNIPTTGKEA